MVNDTRQSTSNALARVLDTAIRIPGTNIRLGLDAIIGLIPGVGDVASAALSSIIVLAAVRSGAPMPVIARMVGNVAIDTAIGSIPVLGDLFDVAFKSNKRNAELLEQYFAQPSVTTRRSKGVIAAMVGAVVLALVAILALAILLARALWGMLT